MAAPIEDNPRRIGGSKWARELAAFKLLYGWAVAVGHIDRSPVLTHTVRRRDGTVVEVANNWPKDVRASNVKWLTPRTYRLWRDIGLRGYTEAGLPQQRWRGRNDGRNAAFADLLFDSGLRLREAGCLLTLRSARVGPGLLRDVAAAIAAAARAMCRVALRRDNLYPHSPRFTSTSATPAASPFHQPPISEHACVRCSLLRPDPAQRPRLEEIRSNLQDRISEAKLHGWLGEVEGLQVSLAGAKDKLAQIDTSDRIAVDLGTPSLPKDARPR